MYAANFHDHMFNGTEILDIDKGLMIVHRAKVAQHASKNYAALHLAG